jgi:hypothetical protein
MKTPVFILGLTFLVGCASAVSAQKDRKLTNGFSINFVAGIPSDAYGAPKGSTVSPEYQPGIWGVQLGNRWYFNPTKQYGVGLMINWVDITTGAAVVKKEFGDYARAVADVTFIEVGPVGTYVLTNDIALDGYYNLRPTGFATVSIQSYSSGSREDDTYTYAGFGFTHALGAAFRYRALNIGIEYVMGGINSDGTKSGSGSDVTLSTQKHMANSFRFMIGAKF